MNSYPTFDLLRKTADEHSLWQNPLLTKSSSGELSMLDYQFLFSQYYFYSKNFTRLLATIMVKCEDDRLRTKLINNFWEEGGESQDEQSHPELFRAFLKNTLGIESTAELKPESYTLKYVNAYIDLCLNSSAVECAAILAFATEGIVPKLYSVLRQGLISAGAKPSELVFFDLHIECDDGHAATLENVVAHYRDVTGWYSLSLNAIDKALNLRDEFFNHIYQDISTPRLDDLINDVMVMSDQHAIDQYSLSKYTTNINNINNRLYHNINQGSSVNFSVDRIPFESSVLDPRILRIEPNSQNESHSHAHESVFYILEGNGVVHIGDQIAAIKAGDIVHVPRWVPHHTINTDSTELVIFAITDFKFTKRFSGNTEDSYRQQRV